MRPPFVSLVIALLASAAGAQGSSFCGGHTTPTQRHPSVPIPDDVWSRETEEGPSAR
ncbi:MAG: hypothetical protein ACK50C_02800 [Gemmatimonadaceae bacterium]